MSFYCKGDGEGEGDEEEDTERGKHGDAEKSRYPLPLPMAHYPLPLNKYTPDFPPVLLTRRISSICIDFSIPLAMS